MELTGTEVLQAHPLQVAAILARLAEGHGRALAEEQAIKNAGDAALAARWREVAAAVTPLIHANLHMELALDLLDSIGETSIPPHLDHVIVQLGLRGGKTGESVPSDARAEQDSLQERAQRHLDLATALGDGDAKRLHLDTAARFATMREAKARDGT